MQPEPFRPTRFMRCGVPVLALMFFMCVGAPVSAATCPALLDHRMPRLQDEKPQDLCSYAGQVVLVVNTASFCGFTPQYKALEALYTRYKPRGLVVLGFPSNDFGDQEPGAAKDIAALCENTFGVRFPMFAKSHVTGPQRDNSLYKELQSRTGQAPRWNFHKYLISRDGRTVSSHLSETDPQGSEFVATIEKLLAAP